jgi:D-cysteine desulfhydrase family pyridoxal phosphate-dependent enzyme
MTLDKKFSLGFFPTPLQPLPRLSAKYAGYNLYIKRDDNTGLACGGNKTRKLEFLIQEAIAGNCDTVITAGAQQSNHCRQTAAACAIAGLECHLMLGGTEPLTYSGNLLLSHLLGAKIHFTGENRKGEGIENLKSELSSNGKKVYVIPYGGSNITGALGFADAMRELKNQMTEINLSIDYIFFASSSGGMQSGMMLGKDLFDLNIELMPVSIDKEGMHGRSLQEVVFNIVNEGGDVLGIQKQYKPDDVVLITDYNVAGYGIVTVNEMSAIRELAMTEGILLDPVYTGRAFFGMTDHLRKGKLKPNSNVLFWHTGGIPAIFHYVDQMIG